MGAAIAQAAPNSLGSLARKLTTLNFAACVLAVAYREECVQQHNVCSYDRLQVISKILFLLLGDRGSTVVKVLRYKSEGRWFDSRWCHWIFPLTEFFRSHCGPGVDSASNRNEYQEYFLGVKMADA
jgi:hypothetical protein